MIPFPKVPPQIARLALLTVLIVCVYLLGRYFLTPASFGQYGHYRGAALEEAAMQSPVFAGKAACSTECHPKQNEMLAAGEHKGLSCESCHGPNLAHVNDRQLKVNTYVACLRCHKADPARSKFIHQIDPNDHYTDERCVGCHIPHQPNEFPEE